MICHDLDNNYNNVTKIFFNNVLHLGYYKSTKDIKYEKYCSCSNIDININDIVDIYIIKI